MRAVIQRVARASVSVDDEMLSEIARGLLVLLGVGVSDGEADAVWMADKVVGMRLFEDAHGKFNHAVIDIGGEILLVSQFTLYADTRKGRRPSFSAAAGAVQAEALYRRVVDGIAQRGVPVRCGRFGARMRVSLVNEGPVTVVIDSARTPQPSNR